MRNLNLNARDLGRVRMSDFCPRCFWFTSKFPLRFANPFRSPMPGIVSILDSHIKHAVKSSFLQRKELPHWLAAKLGGIKIVDVLQPQKWEITIDDVILRGEPDALWKLHDSSLFIADFKVAQMNENQKALFPLYEAQLKAYAYLAERHGHTVSRLALIYLQPEKDEGNSYSVAESSVKQLILGFECIVKDVTEWRPEEIEEMVQEAKSILIQPSPPEGRKNCKRCEELKKWLESLYEAWAQVKTEV